MSNMYEAEITLVDPTNPSIGYQVKITNGGEMVFFTSVDPIDGSDLVTFTQAVRVCLMRSARFEHEEAQEAFSR